MTCESDLLVIGGGPAGLSAAINGASEGLAVRLLDAGISLGGQARESSSIENYPGFPDGVTGDELMSCFVRQAHKFSTTMLCPMSVARIQRDGNRLIIMTEDYQEFVARSVLISIGLSYRRLSATGIGPLMGRGVYYGMPLGKISLSKQCIIGVVGGANSAGQAVLKLAQNTKAKIKMFIRKTIGDQMSQYLIDRIRAAENIEICENCEVTATSGTKKLEDITIHENGDKHVSMPMDYLFIFIGASPKTLWLSNTIDLDERKFIKTWNDVTPSRDLNRQVLPYETSIPGVFAAGDVRLGSTKRIATAIGEGAAALQMIHGYLAL